MESLLFDESLLVSSIVLLNFLGTKTKNSRSLLYKFSLKNNLKILFSNRESRRSIKCIDGIKVLTALWLMLGHRLSFFHHLSTTQNIHDTSWWTPEGLLLSFITSFTLGVDIFLIITIILATQSLIEMFER
jgi:hypothetical protein